MTRERRRQRDATLLDGFVTGPEAATEPTARAVELAADADVLILVEGVSDQIAVETLAGRQGVELAALGVVTVPMGGAQAIARMITAFGPAGSNVRLAGLCDAAEEPFFQTALRDAGIIASACRDDMARAGFHVCVDDLEDELIRALGPAAMKELFDRNGDLGSFHTLQKQAAWSEQPIDAQMRRFMGAGARRKSRYARLMVEAIEPTRVPAPLDAVLRDTVGIATGSSDHAELDRVIRPGSVE